MALMAPPVEAEIPATRRRWRQARGGYKDLDRPTRRYLTKATVTLFAIIFVVAYLLPLAYGFITGLKSPEQMSDPRQPILPMSPETATIDGEEYPIVVVPFDDGTRELALVDKGREASGFVDPDEPERPHRVGGPLAHARAGDHSRRSLGQLLDRGPDPRPSQVAVQHRRHRRARHGRDAHLVRARRLRTVALQRPVREADHGVADRRHHPAPLRHDRSDLRRVSAPRLDRHVAAADRPALLRQRFQRVPAPPVLHDDPPRAR